MRAWAIAAALGAGACGEEERPYQGRCASPPRPPAPDRVRLEPVFAGVEIEDAVALVQRPGDDSRWYVAAKSGVVWTFENAGDATPEPFADLADAVVLDVLEGGLLDIAFHPDFPTVPDVFFSYDAPGGGGAFVSRISRMTSDDGGLTVDRASETVVLELEQPYSNHNGGEIAFGPDGLLYIGLGDGGSAGDPGDRAQNPDELLGKVLRIDVDGAEPYAIPPDNPFATGGGRAEIFALGFRNPWRFGFDSETGALWVGDVGQHTWEEVDRVELGGNYGWNVMEGTDCFGADTCDESGFFAPIAQYRNTGVASVIGGSVYRGGAIAELGGTYVFSDFYFGTIFGVDAEGGELQELGAGADFVAAWAQGADGELYAVHYGGGISRLVAAEPAGDDDFPRLLSQTGCVDIAAPQGAVPETIPYDVVVPFWSDGADKTRALAPGGGAALVGDDGDWDLPPGTVLVKSFFRGEVPIETRLLVRHQDGGWAGYGYAWREDGSDADYVATHLEAEREGAPWVFPSTRECDGCHTAEAGASLGLTTGQLTRTVSDPELGEVDQLDRLVALGVLDERPTAAPLPALDGAAPASERVRAYLDVNCSMCHRPEGPGGRSRMDLRFATPLADAGVCDEPPRAGDLGLVDARIVAPGDPATSVLSARLHAVGSAHMPPLGITTVDEEGAALVDAWISELAACP